MSSHTAIHWTGGKARQARRILAAFPDPSQYKVYVEPFGGSASLLFAKPRNGHLEVLNDRNERLISFWMKVREEVEQLQWKLRTVPYSEALFLQYRESLRKRENLDAVEEAARWFYVNRSTISGHIDSSKGWDYTSSSSKINYAIPSTATSYQNAVELLALFSARLDTVQIHAWDFEKVIGKYATSQTLFYADPPYLGFEHCYEVDGTASFTLEDHVRLARLCNATSAMVAISYYEHSLLNELYPANKWRRQCWRHAKDSSHFNVPQTVDELLLMNYPDQRMQELWTEEIM